MIRTAPRTPNPGSSLVARTWSGAAEAEADAETADGDVGVGVGGIVMLTLNTVGRTVDTERDPERETEVKELVSSERETLGWTLDWPDTTPTNASAPARTAKRGDHISGSERLKRPVGLKAAGIYTSITGLMTPRWEARTSEDKATKLPSGQ